MRTLWLTSWLVTAALALTACMPVAPMATSGDIADGAPLRVVATYSVLGDLVQNVAGDAIELTVLVGAASDPHVYEPTPQDAVALAEADILLENGLGFESWLDDLFAASGSAATRVAVSDGVDVLTFEAGAHEHHDDGAGEAQSHDDVAPLRLAVADGSAGVVHLIDVASGENLASYEVAGPARVYAGADGTLAYAVQGEASRVDVIDSGIRFTPHDDHFHVEVVDPGLLDFSLDNAQPVHFVMHGEQIVLFSDGDGLATLFTDAIARENGPVQRFDSGRPHHGVAVPLGDALLISLPDPDDAEAILPVGVTVRSMSDEVVATFAECPGLHGEASLGHAAAAFGCSDGVMVVRRDGDGWSSQKIANPAENPNNARVGTLYYNESSELLVGNFSREGLALVDVEAGSMATLLLPEPMWAFGFSQYDPHLVLALTIDGVLHAIDIESGEFVGSVAAVDAFALPTQDEHGVLRPTLLASGEMAYVSSPATGEVVEVHVAEMAVERRLPVTGAPFALAAFGALANPHAGADAEASHDHDHGEFDPHTWMSPLNAVIMVQNIEQALSAADPANRAAYAANAAAYTDELMQLDSTMREQFGMIAEAQRILVTTHDLLGYFARDYGFTVLGSALSSVTTEAADPSAAQIAALVDEIRASRVPAIFVENVGNPELMQRIAGEAGVVLAPPLHTHGLGEEGSGAETYLGMMGSNATIISEALR